MPLPIPTPEEMLNWFPDPAQPRFRIELNVMTGERKEIELTLEEYRRRHVAKLISRNEREALQVERQRLIARQAVLDALLDKIEADSTIIDRLATR